MNFIVEIKEAVSHANQCVSSIICLRLSFVLLYFDAQIVHFLVSADLVRVQTCALCSDGISRSWQYEYSKGNWIRLWKQSDVCRFSLRRRWNNSTCPFFIVLTICWTCVSSSVLLFVISVAKLVAILSTSVFSREKGLRIKLPRIDAANME